MQANLSPFVMTVFASLWLINATSCVSSRSQKTPDGNEIPGRRLLQVEAAEYKCEPLFAKGIKEGQTYGFCLYR